jgi:hypothetical protein
MTIDVNPVSVATCSPYDVAPDEALQLKGVSIATPVALFAGVLRAGAEGVAATLSDDKALMPLGA